MLTIDTKESSEKIEHFIRLTLQQAGFEKVIIALSGGVDSSVAASLAVRALGFEHVLVALLPYGELNKDGMNDAKVLMEKLAIQPENVSEISITKPVDTVLQQMKDIDNIRRGNVMARVRMIYLYDLAKKHKALVLGTENKTEYALGYYTRFGDEASDIEPIRGLYKTQIWELARYLQLPEKIINKPPTAGLWDNQTDEKEFGFSYHDADRVIYYHYEHKMSPEEIIQQHNIPAPIVAKVITWVSRNSFKHQLPKVFW